MNLFDEIDKEKTKKNVKNKLSQYRMLKRLANEEYIPKVTAMYSFEPRTVINVNYNAMEQHIVRRVYAQKLIEEIETAINRIDSAFERQILIEKYCKPEKSDIEIYLALNYSESEFYRALERAYFKFSEIYHSGEMMVFHENLNLHNFLGESWEKSGRISGGTRRNKV